MAVAFRLLRLSRPKLHQDALLRVDLARDMGPAGEPFDGQQAAALNPIAQRTQLAHPTDATGLTALLELAPVGTAVRLGETFTAIFTLTNLTAVTLSAISMKVELTIERGGSSGAATVLHDSSHAPLAALPPGGRIDARISFDVRDVGQHSLAASTVFTDAAGERKYQVQFFKLTATNPLVVRTRVRPVPPRGAAHGDGAASGGGDGSAASCGCFVEIGIENVLTVPLLLQAVRFLAAPGVVAHGVEEGSLQGGGSGGSSGSGSGNGSDGTPARAAGVVGASAGTLSLSAMAAEVAGAAAGRGASVAGVAAVGKQGGGGDNAAGEESDTLPVRDSRGSHQQPWGGAGAADGLGGGGLQAHPQQQVQLQVQPQRVQQHQVQQPQLAGAGAVPADSSGPLAAFRASLHVLSPGGGARHFLWRLTQPPQPQAPALGQPPQPQAAAQGGAGSCGHSLGRLEMQWASLDGATGRLQTQPILGLQPGSRDVSLRLSEMPREVQLEEPFTLSLTVAHCGGPPPGALRLVYNSTAGGPGQLGASSAGSAAAARDVKAGPQGQQQQPPRPPSRATPPRAAAPAGGGAGSAGIAVLGPHSLRLEALPPGASCNVVLTLLPLQAGMQRLPTFLVVHDKDGRALDVLHDLHVLVAS